MRILAIESATGRPAVALLEDGRLLAERAAAGDATRSELLLPAIDGLLGEAGVSAQGLDGFAIGIGPGSFTGLRVGLATLKGLAFGLDRPVAAVPTLAALARSVGEPRPSAVAALLDARRGEYYAALYAPGRDSEPVLADGLYRPDTLAKALPADCLLVGDVGAEHRARLAPLLSCGARPAECAAPFARWIGVLGEGLLAEGRGQPAAELVPRYVRRAEAEVQRLGSATESV